MQTQKENPAALAGAHRVELLAQKQASITTTQTPDCLAVAIIADRHKLTFSRAQLICHLAGIGGVQ